VRKWEHRLLWLKDPLNHFRFSLRLLNAPCLFSQLSQLPRNCCIYLLAVGYFTICSWKKGILTLFESAMSVYNIIFCMHLYYKVLSELIWYTSCIWNCLNSSIWRFLTSSWIAFCTEPNVSSRVRWTSWSENEEEPCSWSVGPRAWSDNEEEPRSWSVGPRACDGWDACPCHRK